MMMSGAVDQWISDSLPGLAMFAIPILHGSSSTSAAMLCQLTKEDPQNHCFFLDLHEYKLIFLLSFLKQFHGGHDKLGH